MSMFIDSNLVEGRTGWWRQALQVFIFLRGSMPRLFMPLATIPAGIHRMQTSGAAARDRLPEPLAEQWRASTPTAPTSLRQQHRAAPSDKRAGYERGRLRTTSVNGRNKAWRQRKRRRTVNGAR